MDLESSVNKSELSNRVEEITGEKVNQVEIRGDFPRDVVLHFPAGVDFTNETLQKLDEECDAQTPISLRVSNHMVDSYEDETEVLFESTKENPFVQGLKKLKDALF